MPVYEYYCPACKSGFEELRPMSRISAPAHCPTCESRSWKKLSVFAVGQSLMGERLSTSGGGGCACGGNCGCA